MIIEGFFKGDAAFISARLISKSLGIDRAIDFLLDTGASKTVLLDRDVRFCGIDFHKLKRFATNLRGIGGSVDTYIIGDASLTFESESGQKIGLKLPVFVLKHDIEKVSQEERMKILRIPSVLGRDVINKYKLVFDKRRNRVFLADKIY